MNESQRAVLQKHYRHLADDIILTDNLLAALYQQHIFERNMIDLIKAEKSEGEKVGRMLDMLPKRGPSAFDKFVAIIQHDYPWLAAMLNNSLKEEKMTRAPTRGSSRIEQMRLDSERTSIDFSALDLDSDIKARVSSFIHKQFGHSKRISENDKKSMVRFLSLQIQGERKRVASATSSESSSSSGSTVIITVADKCCGTDIDYGNVNHSRINNRVQHLFDKFEEYKRSSSVTPGIESRCSDTTSTPPSRVQPRSGKERPKASDVIKAPMTPSTLENVLSEVDFLLDKIIDMENEMNKCHVLLGNNEGSLSLSLLIYDLSTKNKNREKELKQEKLKSEKMLTELYENSKRITRLEQTNVQQRSLLQHQAGETEKLARDLQHRKDHIVHLEQMSRLNSDKTSPIENIKHMVRDIRHSKVNPSKAESVRTSTDSLGKSTRGGQFTSRYSPSKSMANSGPTRYSPTKSKQGQTSSSDNGISTRRNSQASNSKIIKKKI